MHTELWTGFRTHQVPQGGQALSTILPDDAAQAVGSAVEKFTSDKASQFLEGIHAALQDGRADDAEAIWEQWQSAGSLPPLAQAIPVYIMLVRGQTLDALRFMNDMPEGFCPELRTLCLRLAGDPTWVSHAQALEDSDQPLVREGMRLLLQSAGAPGMRR